MNFIFRGTILLVLGSYLMLVILPYYHSSLLTTEELEAFKYHGLGAHIDLRGPIPYVFLISSVISLWGMYKFQPWARKLYSGIIALSLVVSPLWGIIISTNIDSFFASILNLGLGVLLALSYTSVANEFNKNK